MIVTQCKACNYRDDAGVSESNEARKWQWNYNDNNTSPDLNYYDVMLDSTIHFIIQQYLQGCVGLRENVYQKNCLLNVFSFLPVCDNIPL